MDDNQKSSTRTVLVIGDNPEELMSKYDMNLKVEPYIKYRYLDAEKMRKSAIKSIKQLMQHSDEIQLSKFQQDYLKNRMETLKGMTSFEYYSSLTNGMYYDEEGNAMTNINPNGKWIQYNIGGNFSYPFITEEGKETYQAQKGNINWDSIHMNSNTVFYFSRIWEMIKEGDAPATDDEKHLFDEWKDRRNYLDNFKTKEDLIRHNCSFWSYAVLDENGWHSVDESNENEWIDNFYDKFIGPLDSEKMLTIYEFRFY